MTPEQICQLGISALEELKGKDIVKIDITTLTNMADYMVICTGTSTRHVKALAENVVTVAKRNGIKPVRMEGEQESEWVLVDLGDVIVHVMLAQTRAFYSLEDLWEPIREMRESKS